VVHPSPWVVVLVTVLERRATEPLSHHTSSTTTRHRTSKQCLLQEYRTWLSGRAIEKVPWSARRAQAARVRTGDGEAKLIGEKARCSLQR
jgi:hypothetical protein